MVIILYFGIFHSKSIIILVLCLYLAKNIYQVLLSVFKMNDTVNFADNFYVNIQYLSNHNFPFKVSNTDFTMPGLKIAYFQQFLFGG